MDFSRDRCAESATYSLGTMDAWNHRVRIYKKEKGECRLYCLALIVECRVWHRRGLWTLTLKVPFQVVLIQRSQWSCSRPGFLVLRVTSASPRNRRFAPLGFYWILTYCLVSVYHPVREQWISSTLAPILSDTWKYTQTKLTQWALLNNRMESVKQFCRHLPFPLRYSYSTDGPDILSNEAHYSPIYLFVLF